MLLRRPSSYLRLFSSAKAKALFVPPNEATWLYPIPIPRSDAAIRKGTEKWREIVHDGKYCPFIKSPFGAKYRIEVERSNDPSMWMQRVFSFLEDEQCNTMLIVLPNLLIPTQDHASTMHSLMKEFKMSHIFGEQFVSFRIEMSRLGIRQCMPHDNGVLHDVAFHPLNGPPNWSPWPIIQVRYLCNTSGLNLPNDNSTLVNPSLSHSITLTSLSYYRPGSDSSAEPPLFSSTKTSTSVINHILSLLLATVVQK